MRTWVPAILSLFLLPQSGLGQACVGAPTDPGTSSFQASGAWSSGAHSVAAAVRSLSRTGVGVHAGYGITFLENTSVETQSISGAISPELTSNSVSICLVAEAVGQWASDGSDLGGWTLAGGVGVGTELSVGESSWVPFALGSIVKSWVQSPSNDVYGAFRAGLLYKRDLVYLGPWASITTLEGDDVSVGVQVGLQL